GEVTQNVAYIPYGEVFVEQRNGTWNTPYLFNAKELDEETGLYYYGARYLDPTGTRWLSVDPLFEKYVGMTPYGYCAGNPVAIVDVDGNDWIRIMEKKVIWYAGNYGNTDNPIHEYKASSGLLACEESNNEDLRNTSKQYVPNGPTVEGKYQINLKLDPDRMAEPIYLPDDGVDLKRGSGIEQIPKEVVSASGEDIYTFPGWGKQRAHLDPISVPDVKGRDEMSFYMHDSSKGFTHGCVEIESSFFDDLRDYRNDNNTYIEIMVKYESKNSSTYGETDK
ncbi:MAG: RHS repeat-associated core domain-containing protein, partial [Bacteroidales bacterium]|nr:RHS repeat-associated core domain-containing protein [Bacteroidales bacterium]